MNIRRYIYRAGWPIALLYFRIRKPHNYAVRTVVEHEGKLLLVRESYGKRRWSFPGGLMKRREQPEVAARRELMEETGVEAGALTLLGTQRAVSKYGRWDSWIYEGKARSPELTIDKGEILEAGWFSPDGFPEPRSEHLAEVLKMRKS